MRRTSNPGHRTNGRQGGEWIATVGLVIFTVAIVALVRAAIACVIFLGHLL